MGIKNGHALIIIRPYRYCKKPNMSFAIACEEWGQQMMKQHSIIRDVVEGLWGACLVAIALFTPFLVGWQRWGASDAEVERTLPGDDLVPHVKGGFTQAVIIAAAREQVWEWVVQLGQDRAGFYSYDFLENLVGSNIRTIDVIAPEYAHTGESSGLCTHP